MDILQDRLKCLSFIISRLNLTWLNALCSIDSHVIALTLAASIICSAIIVP